MMNEFALINKYLKPLTLKNSGAFNLSDDIFFDKEKAMGVSVDTYVEGVHFVSSSDPNNFLKKILRSSLSDLYCKGLKPKYYFLSFALKKNLPSQSWLKKVKKILFNEQSKFNIFLAGGDTTYSKKLVITVMVIAYSKYKPVLRNGAVVGDDIYLTGTIGDAYLGLNVIKKKKNFGKYNNFFKNKYHEPQLAFKFTPYIQKIASASIDVSDGLAQDLKHICDESNCGAFVNLNFLPLSPALRNLVKKKKINLKEVFSRGDDYQILFTSNRKNRSKIDKLSKKLIIKISKIGSINKYKNIVFEYNKKTFKLNSSKMGYTHTF